MSNDNPQTEQAGDSRFVMVHNLLDELSALGYSGAVLVAFKNGEDDRKVFADVFSDWGESGDRGELLATAVDAIATVLETAAETGDESINYEIPAHIYPESHH